MILPALFAAAAVAACPTPDAAKADYEAYAVAEGVRTAPSWAPRKVFDNLYYLGIKSTAAWALDTPNGIVVIDALNAKDAEAIPDGLKALGLDPTRIKYVLVSHGHSDHYGGAKMLQERYGARVVMSAPDWDYVLKGGQRGAAEPPPKRDVESTSSLVLGGVKITIVPTPGHTPGAQSFLFPVTDRGKRHVVAYFGGMGEPRGDFEAYFNAQAAYRELAWKAGADVLLSNHPYNDKGLSKMRALNIRKAGDPHPYVVGKQAIRDDLTQGIDCGRAMLAAMQAPK